MSKTRILLLIASIALLATTGCSKSSTSEASSESSSNSSASSSGSSSPSSGVTGYTRDVRDYTVEWLLSGGDAASFESRVAEEATEAGITDWRADEKTYNGIGRGLKKAGITGARYEGISKELGGTDPQRLEWIAKGYKDEPQPKK